MDDYHRVVRVLIEEGHELFQDVRGREVEHVLLLRPRSRHDTVPEIHAREILEDRGVPERTIVVSIEGRRELLQDDFLRPGESHITDPIRDLRAVATIAEAIVTGLRA